MCVHKVCKYIQGTGKSNTAVHSILSVINTTEGWKMSGRWFCGVRYVRQEAPTQLFPIWRPLTGERREEEGKGEMLGYVTL